MTKDEFLARYHNFRTDDIAEAKAYAALANAEGVEDDVAVPVDFGALGYGLMLMSAFALMRGILPDLKIAV